MATSAQEVSAQRRPRTFRAALVLLMFVSAVIADEQAGAVDRDGLLTVSAEIRDGRYGVVEFGDVLTLAVTITFDPQKVQLVEPDESFFSNAWPAVEGPALLDWTLERQSAPHGVRVLYRFQIVACPAAAATCPGKRHYTVPQLALQYRENAAETLQTLRVQPEPSMLSVNTGIEMDEEDQIQPFAVYFPDGGYPLPLNGRDETQTAVISTAVAACIFFGGLIMWPFNRKSANGAVSSVARWRVALQELQNDDSSDDSHYLDALRRCVVWYCSDELSLDAFLWLDLAEQNETQDENAQQADLRRLFVELLHKPVGNGPALRERFEELTRQAGRA